eukprot:2930662-Rhodomonas_salina.1
MLLQPVNLGPTRLRVRQYTLLLLISIFNSRYISIPLLVLVLGAWKSVHPGVSVNLGPTRLRQIHIGIHINTTTSTSPRSMEERPPRSLTGTVAGPDFAKLERGPRLVLKFGLKIGGQ